MLLFDLLRTLQKFGDSSYVDLQTVNFGAVWVGPFLGASQLSTEVANFPFERHPFHCQFPEQLLDFRDIGGEEGLHNLCDGSPRYLYVREVPR